ncbi:MAG: hypothetical protein CSA68_02650 [Rhodobacterales bacterium]|nr:MAG: hypothetical protein CSA68_02650 [Rhodobacterales bacterium]
MTHTLSSDDTRLIDTLMTQGLDAYHGGDYNKALKKFEKCLRTGEESQPVIQATAYIAVRAEKWANAARLWRLIIEQTPRRAGPIAQYMNALIKDRDFETAEAFAKTHPALQEDALKAQRDSMLIRIYLASGKLSEAQELAETSYDAQSDDKAALEYARGFFEHKSYNAALRWVDKIAADSPLAGQAAMLRARIYYAQKLWEKADAVFSDIASQGDEAAVKAARIFLARIAAGQNNVEVAESRYRLVLQDNPRYEEALNYFIRNALADYNYEKALELLDSNWDSLNAVRRVNFKARALAATDPEQGLEIYRQELSRLPDHTGLRLSYAGFLLDTGQYEEAGTELQTCLTCQPNSIEANKLKLRLLQVTQASFETQLEQAQITLALMPLDVALLNTVGGLLARCNRRAEATVHYKAAVEKVPDAAVLWRNGAYHLAMDNRLEEAAEFARRGVAMLGTKEAIDLTNAAWIMQAAGLEQEALSYITSALDKDPNSVKALETAVDLLMSAGEFAKAWAHIQHLDSLHFPRRDAKIAHSAARCMAAFRAVAAHSPKRDNKIPAGCDGHIEPVQGLFPEVLLRSIAANAQPDLDSERSGIVQFSSNLGSGGAERQVAYVMQGIMADPLPNDRCVLAVNSLDANNANDFFLPEVNRSGCEVIDLDHARQTSEIREVLSNHPEYGDQIRALASMPAELSRMALPFFAYLVRTKPRVVHLWQDAINIAGGIAAVAAGVPQIVLCTRSTRPVEIRRYRRYLHEGYLALLDYAGTLKIVNNSANGARNYEEWLGLEAGSIDVFYNGYDFDALCARAKPQDRTDIRARFSIPGSAKVIGGVMRFSAEKRPDLWVATVIEAARKDPDLYGLIVGEGPMRESMVEQVAAQGLADRIHFAGRQTPVEPWMCAMDMLFLSSVTEGLPNVLIEAQALGVPVATMRVGGAPEALEDGRSGIVLDEATPDELADHLLAALADDATMDQMKAAATQVVFDRFSLATMIGTLKSFYQVTPHSDK